MTAFARLRRWPDRLAARVKREQERREANRRLKEALVDLEHRNGALLETRLARDDEMLAFIDDALGGDVVDAAMAYFRSGDGMIDGLEAALFRVGRCLSGAESFLEFACGHGRFTRHLVHCLPSERVTVSDIHPGAVAFVTRTFGVDGFVSVADPADLRHEKRYDIVFAASLFSHLSLDIWTAWLGRLAELLAPGGLLVISTHGRSALDALGDRVGLEERADGFWYGTHNETGGRLDGNRYGTAYVDEAFVRRAVDDVGAALLAWIPQGLWSVQDVYVIANEGPGSGASKAVASSP